MQRYRDDRCKTEVPAHHHQASSQRPGRGLVRFPQPRTSGRQPRLKCLRGGFSRLGEGRDIHDRKSILLANRCMGQRPWYPADDSGSVFQPFVSYGKPEGSGLGLAIAKKIVEDHGGEIYLDGRTGTGTLFKITIPFASPQRAVPHTSAGPIRSTRISRAMARRVDRP